MDLNKETSFGAWVKTNNNITAKLVEKGDWDGHGLGQDKWNGGKQNFLLIKRVM